MKTKIETALADAKKDLVACDMAKIKAAVESLGAVGQELYAQVAQAAGAAGAGPEESGPAADGPAPKKAEKKADVVDAEFEVMDDDKK